MPSTPNQDTQSLDLIAQILAQQVGIGINISPYLTAIQSLNGKVPGEKYKELNLKINSILANSVQGNTEFTSTNISEQISPALFPLVKILVGNGLKSNEAVLEALKCEDKTVVNQALQAKWFFDNSNAFIEADYFINNVLPYISVRTRYKIVKTLSKSLIGADKKAEDFFRAFIDLYSLKEALPLLPACSENFIFNEIMKYKLLLTHNMLLVLYDRYPNLVIRYLNLGNTTNERNEKERKIHTIDLHEYRRFLPHLIRHHVRDFIELSDPYYYYRLGSTLTTLFFKNAADHIIENPRVYLKVWPLKKICKRLTLNQFEIMYGNLFPETEKSFNLSEMLRYLTYYPRIKRLSLLKNLYNLKYSKDLLSNIEHISCDELILIHDMISVDLFEVLFVKVLPSNIDDFNKIRHGFINELSSVLEQYTRENRLKILKEKYKLVYKHDLFEDIENLKHKKLLILFPPNERKIQVMRILETVEENTDAYYNWYRYIPPKDSFPVFKKAIQNSLDEITRCEFLTKMLDSCAIDNSKFDLLDFLSYYNMRHKNERIETLSSVLHHIRSQNLDMNTLSKPHWRILLEIILRIYTKNELYKLDFNIVEHYFDGALYHFMIQAKKDNCITDDMEEDDKILLEKLFEMIIYYNVEVAEKKWLFLDKFINEQRHCLNRLINLLPVKYPEDHFVWQTKNSGYKKLNLVISILESFKRFNQLLDGELADNKKKLIMLDYPWLIETTKELFVSSHLKLNELKYHVKEHAPEFYYSLKESKELEYRYKVNIRSGKAWIELKKNQDSVFTEWQAYLDECRERLQCNSKKGGLAAKRFLLTLKWYKDLPVKFIERCLAEIKVPGSMKVLAILLEGEVFGSIASLFAPKETVVDIYRDGAKDFYKIIQSIPSAINFTNPPVSLDLISLFCQGDYMKPAIQAFLNTSERVVKSKIMIFAENLMKKPVSVKKHGIKLIFKIASENELREYVRKGLLCEKHVSIRALLVQMVKERFISKPYDDTWESMKICISSLNDDDRVSLDILCDMASISNIYASQYINCIISKIEEFSDFDIKLKTTYLCAVLNSISIEVIDFLSEDDIMALLEKYYFDTKSLDLSLSAQTFAKKVFSQPFRCE